MIYVLDLADVEGVRALRAVADFEGHFVPFLERVERNADELVGMEKEILLLTRDLDKAEALISEASDGSFLHTGCFLRDWIKASRQ